MSLDAAFTRIGSWTVTGATVIGLDELDAPPGEADLPLLVPELGGTGGEFLKPLGIMADDGEVVVHVVHKLLVRGIGLGMHSERFSDVLPLMDNYFDTVKDDWTLNGNLLRALTIADTRAGIIEVMGVLYYGVEFRHRWVLKV